MRRLLSLLLTPALLTACDIDLTGLGDGLFGPCYGCYTPSPSVSVMGVVLVGPYLAESGEAVVLLFAPTDTVTPKDSVRVESGGTYWKDFGSSPAPDVCEYRARAVLWTGEKTAFQPFFSNPSSCASSTYASSGPRFGLPDYPELDEPFVVWAAVRVAGQPAKEGEAQLLPPLRIPDGSFVSSAAWIPSNAEGRVVLETTDGAQRYTLCRYAHVVVQATATGEERYAGLDLPSDGICGSERRLPDVRFGTRKAAFGSVYVGTRSFGPLPRAGAGEATVSLVSPIDSTIVGEAVETHDDGRFHVWFPHEMFDPGCDWLIRAEVADQVQYRRLLPDGATTCLPEFYHDFDFTSE